MSVSGGTMSGRVASHDPIMSTMSLLADAKKYEAKIKSLAAAEKSANEAIKRLGDIQNIANAKAAAARARKRAEETLAEAEEKAKILVAEAEQRADAIKQEASAEKGAFDKASRAKTLELKEREETLSSNEDDYGKRLSALQRKEAAVNRKAETNREITRDLERRVSALRAACAEAAGDGQ